MEHIEEQIEDFSENEMEQNSLPVDDNIVLNVENLSVIIKDRFLIKNAYLSVKKGESWAILGEKKSGKTSLLKAISGSLPIHPGQVYISGVDIFENKQALANVGISLDPPVFFKYQTVYDNLKFISILNERNNKEKILQVLNDLGIAHTLNKRVLFLPYYEKKLMSLAVAFLSQPKLLLLDEPFKNLPKESLQKVKNEIRKFRENGTTIIISTTKFETVEDDCDNFIFMEEREIKQILPKEECEKLCSAPPLAFVRVKYPHFAGKLIQDNFNLEVKIMDRRVLFDADEDTTADIVKFLSQNKIAIYKAGFLSKKAEKIFVSLTPYYKEELS